MGETPKSAQYLSQIIRNDLLLVPTLVMHKVVRAGLILFCLLLVPDLGIHHLKE